MRHFTPMRLTMLLFSAVVLLTSTACTSTTKQEIEQYPVLLELIDTAQTINDSSLVVLCEEYNVARNQVYGWKNHWLIYDFPGDTTAFRQAVNGVEVKVYKDPYYIFDRSNCDTGQIQEAWDHKVLTANLVADPAKQQEYMDYHRNQFEQFPEVSAGFCRAEFQQLLMFRNGRQLMLVISYPEGKDYDTLNARTVQNNPRVDEWNAIMGQYQEGIPETEPGETWVFFEPVRLD